MNVEAASSSSKLSRLISSAKNFGATALISIIVSSGVSVFWAARLENSKDRVASINKQREQFDTAQNNVITQLGLYTGKLFDGVGSANKEQLQIAIIAAQLQLSRLAGELAADDREVISRYSAELDNLSRHLRNVTRANELGPVYVSAQKILSMHAEVSERLKSKTTISVF